MWSQSMAGEGCTACHICHHALTMLHSHALRQKHTQALLSGGPGYATPTQGQPRACFASRTVAPSYATPSAGLPPCTCDHQQRFILLDCAAQVSYRVLRGTHPGTITRMLALDSYIADHQQMAASAVAALARACRHVNAV